MQIFIYILIVLVIVILDIVGFIGSITPAIPGPPLCLISLVIAYFYFPQSITLPILITMIVLCLISTTIDYFAPMLVTKIGGGSKYAIIGSTIGVFIGLFFPPFGIIWIPFVGALLGELIENYKKVGKAFKVAFLSFLSFILTTGFKITLCGVISFFSIKACF
jgi:hypothetical protein